MRLSTARQDSGPPRAPLYDHRTSVRKDRWRPLDTRWAPGTIFDLVTLDCPKVRCDTPGNQSYISKGI